MKKIYLDHNATTPTDSRVVEKMKPYLTNEFGNASSDSHPWGWTAQKAVETTRKQVAELIACKPHEVIFTSGATESSNLALIGLAYQLKLNQKQDKIHMITTAVEHSCVLESFKFLKKLDVEVDILPTNPYGQIEISTLEKAIKPHTALISCIWVNNEIGSINPIRQIGKLCREKGILLHSDATQALGKVDINVDLDCVDLLSISGHKVYGPKGIGALYVRSKDPHVQISSILFGGGQEKGIRPGTLNVPGIVGLGEACAILKSEMKAECMRISELRDRLRMGLFSIFPDLKINGHPIERSSMNLNVTLPSFNLDMATSALLPVAFSRGSACHSHSAHRSHVLAHIGMSAAESERSLRLSLGRHTTQEEVDDVLLYFQKANEKQHEANSKKQVVLNT